MGAHAGESGAICSSNECGMCGFGDAVKSSTERERERERERCSVCKKKR